MTRIPVITGLLKYADRLKFRQLFLLTGSLFVVALLTVLFGAWEKTNPKAIDKTQQDPQ